MSDPMTLAEWREATLATAPIFSQYIFASPAEKNAARRAVIRARIEPPAAPERELSPEVRWIHRPPYLKEPGRLRTTYDNTIAVAFSDGTVIHFTRDGRHAERSRGRATRHGRLDVSASVEAERMWRKNVLTSEQEYTRFVQETEAELRLRAIRLGSGWARALIQLPYESVREEYLIAQPESGTWVSAKTGCSVDPSNIVEILEETPVLRKTLPTMTWEEVRVTVEEVGGALTTDEKFFSSAGRTIVFGRVTWKHIYVGLLDSESGGPVFHIDDTEATAPNLRAWIRKSIDQDILRCETLLEETARTLTELRAVVIPE